jgi:hypothetical protein
VITHEINRIRANAHTEMALLIRRSSVRARRGPPRVVERLDDLERVEPIVFHTGALVGFRARRAADTVARSFATRTPW